MFSNFQKLLFCALASTPMLMFAFSVGPPQGRTGAAVDGGLACNACHRGADLNDGRGRLAITVANYTPGTRQTIRVRLDHPTALRWGFQLTARLASDPTKKAGSFTPSSEIRVACGLTGANVAPCSDNDVEFASHVDTSTSPGTPETRTWEIQWTPPATAAGNVIFYAAGNAANNSGNPTGDFIYNTNVTIGSNTGAGPRPAISSGGVADAFTFGNTVSTHSWVAIFGSNFSTRTTTWESSISGANLPTQLDGVSVKINNLPATIYFVSPGQINVLAPIDAATGDVPVVVTTPNGESAPIMVRRAAAAPAFYTPFSQASRFFITAVGLDGSILGKVSADPRVTRPARPGETIAIFGSGFGATNPVYPTDRVVVGTPEVVTTPTIRFGEATGTILGKGNLVAAGLYQFNVTIPASVPEGDVVVTAEINGIRSSTNVFLTIAR